MTTTNYTPHPIQILESELETERARHLMAALTKGEPDSVARRGELASVLFSALQEQYVIAPRTAPTEAIESDLPETRWEPNYVDIAAALLAAGMMQPATPAAVPRIAYERALELDTERRRLARR